MKKTVKQTIGEMLSAWDQFVVPFVFILIVSALVYYGNEGGLVASIFVFLVGTLVLFSISDKYTNI